MNTQHQPLAVSALDRFVGALLWFFAPVTLLAYLFNRNTTAFIRAHMRAVLSWFGVIVSVYVVTRFSVAMFDMVVHQIPDERHTTSVLIAVTALHYVGVAINVFGTLTGKHAWLRDATLPEQTTRAE